jgi:hypothetical protein
MVELGSMPYLQSLTTSYIPYSFDGAILPRLLVLDASAPSLHSQIDIDDIPGQIQVLKLYRYSLRQRRKTPASPRQFPDLRQLYLVKVSLSNLLPRCIMAPKLEHLAFGHATGEEYLDLTPMLQTFCFNGTLLGSTLLRLLTIEGMELGPEIMSHMRQLSTLKNLALLSCRISKAFLTPLWTPSEDMTLPLPSLCALVIENSDERDGDGKFAEMREKCAAARPSLKVFIE